MAVDFRVIFEEGPQGPGKPTTGNGQGAQETAELPAVPPAEKVKGPKADRWKGDPAAGEKKKGDSPELTDALKGLAKFTSDRAGMGPVVNSLENLTKHLTNVYSAVMRGATSVPSGGRTPDAGGVEIKSPQAPSVPGAAPQIPTVGPGAVPPPNSGIPVGTAVPSAAAAPAVTQASMGAGGAGAAGAAGAAEGVGAAIAAMGPLAPIAAAAAVALAAVAAGAYVVKKAFDAIHAEGERIQAYSAELSQAYAMTDLRAELADIRRAQRIGPNASRVEDMRSKVMEKVADIGTEIYAEVAELLVKLEPAIDFLIKTLGLTADSIPAVIDKLTAIAEFTSLNPALIADALKEDPQEKKNRERMEKAVTNFINGKEDKEEEIDDPFMLQLLQNFGQANAARQAAAGGRGGRGRGNVPPRLPAPGAPAGFGGA